MEKKDHEGILDKQYRLQAMELFHEEKYKQSLILFQEVKIFDQDTTEIMVLCAYQYWKELLVTNQSVDTVIKSLNESFTKLLTLNTSIAKSTTPYNYIRLSHIYLTEGLLSDALKILQLASARGHFVDNIILIQMWSIVKRVNSSSKESEKIMHYLSSSLPVESHKQQTNSKTTIYLSDSTLPVSHAFLLLANYFRKLSTSSRTITERKTHFTKFQSIIKEAYFLYYFILEENLVKVVEWFNNPMIWIEMGIYQSSTPFILLSEDFLWEAFVRNPLDVSSIDMIRQSMNKYKRSNKIPALLSKALTLNPWDLYLRNEILTIETETVLDPDDRSWKILFDSQHFALSKIQAVYRSWIFWKHWPETREQIIYKRLKFEEAMQKSYEKLNLVKQKYFMNLIHQWKIFVIEWKQLTEYQSTNIQKIWRRYRQVKQYQTELECFRIKNSKFLVLYQLHHDLSRAHCMRRWYRFYSIEMKKRNASILVQYLQRIQLSRKISPKLNRMFSILKLKRFYQWKKYFKVWRYVGNKKRIRTAIVTIRFFIRGIFRRLDDRQIENSLQHVEEKVLQMVLAPRATISQLPVVRQYWKVWRIEFIKMVKIYKTKRLIILLTILWKRMKARRKFSIKKIRDEVQQAYSKKKWYMKVSKIFFMWKYNAASYCITRFIRTWIAMGKLHYRQVLHSKLQKLKKERKNMIKNKVFNRIRKYNYLIYREKIRAIRKLFQFYHILQFRKKLRKLLMKKLNMYKLLNTIYLKTFHYQYKRFKMLNKYLYCKKKLKKMAHILERALKGMGFNQWKSKTEIQIQLMKYPDWILKRLNLRMIHPDGNRLLGNYRIQSNNKILYDYKKLILIKSLKCWMISYHVKIQLRRNLSKQITHQLWQNILTHYQAKQQSIQKIQTFWRAQLARRHSQRLLTLSNKEYFLFCFIQNNQRKRIFYEIKNVFEKSVYRRKLIQTAAKNYLQWKLYCQQYTRDMALSNLIQTSKFQSVLMKSCLTHIKRVFLRTTFQHMMYIDTTSSNQAVHDLLMEYQWNKKIQSLNPNDSYVEPTRQEFISPYLQPILKSNSVVRKEIKTSLQEIDQFLAWKDSAEEINRMKSIYESTTSLPFVQRIKKISSYDTDRRDIPLKSLASYPTNHPIYRKKSNGSTSRPSFGSPTAFKKEQSTTKRYLSYMNEIKLFGLLQLDGSLIRSEDHPPQYNPSDNHLLPSEVEALLGQCNTLVCKNVTISLIKLITIWFQGDKLVITDGNLSNCHTESDLITFRVLFFSFTWRSIMGMDTATTNNPIDGSLSLWSNSMDRLDSHADRSWSLINSSTVQESKGSPLKSLSIVNLILPFRYAIELSQYFVQPMTSLGIQIEPSITYLQIDVTSVGVMGMALLLMSLQYVTSLTSLTLNFVEINEISSVFCDGFKAVSKNPNLQELRILDANTVGYEVAETLKMGLQDDFKRLTYLEFPICSSKKIKPSNHIKLMAAADEVIEIGKRRTIGAAMNGSSSGLSVIIINN